MSKSLGLWISSCFLDTTPNQNQQNNKLEFIKTKHFLGPSISPLVWKDADAENNYHGFQFFDETSDCWSIHCIPGVQLSVSLLWLNQESKHVQTTTEIMIPWKIFEEMRKAGIFQSAKWFHNVKNFFRLSSMEVCHWTVIWTTKLWHKNNGIRNNTCW